jgi:hypothetical protein
MIKLFTWMYIAESITFVVYSYNVLFLWAPTIMAGNQFYRNIMTTIIFIKLQSMWVDHKTTDIKIDVLGICYARDKIINRDSFIKCSRIQTKYLSLNAARGHNLPPPAWLLTFCEQHSV